MPDATLVIPQRNLGSLTAGLIQSLREHEPSCWPVIVVDDGSEDGSAERIRTADFADCRLVEQPQRGVTAAWNAGIARVHTPFVVLMNNDVRISGTFVDRLVDPLRTRPASIVGVKWRMEPLVSRRILAGWCWGFAVDLWRALGGFDETMRWYYSDADFQWRAAMGGRELAGVDRLPLIHWGHQTTQRDPRRRAIWLADRQRFREAAGRRPRGCA